MTLPASGLPSELSNEPSVVADLASLTPQEVFAWVERTGKSGLAHFTHRDHVKSVWLHRGEVVDAQRFTRGGDATHDAAAVGERTLLRFVRDRAELADGSDLARVCGNEQDVAAFGFEVTCDELEALLEERGIVEQRIHELGDPSEQAPHFRSFATLRGRL